MSKILAIDYGLKRCGIAITDDAKLVASPFITVDEKELLDFLAKQVNTNRVDEIVIGLPVNLKGMDTDITAHIRQWVEKLKSLLPGVLIVTYDERFTSALAQKSIAAMEIKKKKREQKGLLDKVSAAILLQNYLDSKKFNSLK